MKIHISTFVLIWWGFWLFISGLYQDIVMISLASLGFCVALRWNFRYYNELKEELKNGK